MSQAAVVPWAVVVARIRPAAAVICALLVGLLAACDPEAPAPTLSNEAANAPFSGSETDLGAARLETLVAPIALYPDDLLALMLPAATQPLQVIDAHRFLEQRKTNANLQPSRAWDPSVVALLNYPEALALMNADLGWLQQLGTSVVYQQAGVMDAVQGFRRKAADSGNLKSDDKQLVSTRPGVSGTGDVIVIESANPETVSVPVYDATKVVQPAPYPYYWSAPYPYYYDPWAPYYMGASFGALIGFGCDWDDDEIYRGDIDREQIKQRIEDRRNSNVADQIRRNPENRWQADRSGIERAQASSAAARAAMQQRAGSGAARRGGDRSVSSGAFSGVDRGAAASRFSARGAGSLAGAPRGGFRGGGGGRRR